MDNFRRKIDKKIDSTLDKTLDYFVDPTLDDLAVREEINCDITYEKQCQKKIQECFDGHKIVFALTYFLCFLSLFVQAPYECRKFKLFYFNQGLVLLLFEVIIICLGLILYFVNIYLCIAVTIFLFAFLYTLGIICFVKTMKGKKLQKLWLIGKINIF